MDSGSLRSSRGGARVAALTIAASVFLSACSGAVPLSRVQAGRAKTANSTATTAPSLPPSSPLRASALSNDSIVQVVKRVAPAVVNVTTRVQSTNALFGGPSSRAVGTGFVIRSDGVIVTNFHVVENALNIKVTLPPPDGRTFTARAIGGDPDRDLAVLKVNGRDLPTVPLGDSSKLALGERVIAIGYALALPGGPTVTSGILSSLARTVRAQDPSAPRGMRTYQDALQTDAAINPGNSGGPLLDLAGNVVGINTAGSAQAENIGFAIAVDAAKPTINEAIERPAGPVAYLGVTTETVDSGVAAQFGLPVARGALVVGVTPGGPALRAGVQRGDVIVGFDGKPVGTSDDLGRAIQGHHPGDRVSVQLVRTDGTRVTVTATLAVRPLPASP